jgi:hypothetical protein
VGLVACLPAYLENDHVDTFFFLKRFGSVCTYFIINFPACLGTEHVLDVKVSNVFAF